jgi:hypothetical protein
MMFFLPQATIVKGMQEIVVKEILNFWGIKYASKPASSKDQTSSEISAAISGKD